MDGYNTTGDVDLGQPIREAMIRLDRTVDTLIYIFSLRWLILGGFVGICWLIGFICGIILMCILRPKKNQP